MLDQWPTIVLTGKSSDFLVIVALDIEQNINILSVAFDSLLMRLKEIELC